MLREGGRQCAIEITSISLTGAHSVLMLYQSVLENKGESFKKKKSYCSEIMGALKTKIGLAVANEST